VKQVEIVVVTLRRRQLLTAEGRAAIDEEM
jgi:hypothetical protein